MNNENNNNQQAILESMLAEIEQNNKTIKEMQAKLNEPKPTLKEKWMAPENKGIRVGFQIICGAIALGHFINAYLQFKAAGLF